MALDKLTPASVYSLWSPLKLLKQLCSTIFLWPPLLLLHLLLPHFSLQSTCHENTWVQYSVNNQPSWKVYCRWFCSGQLSIQQSSSWLCLYVDLEIHFRFSWPVSHDHRNEDFKYFILPLKFWGMPGTQHSMCTVVSEMYCKWLKNPL